MKIKVDTLLEVSSVQRKHIDEYNRFNERNKNINNNNSLTPEEIETFKQKAMKISKNSQ